MVFSHLITLSFLQTQNRTLRARIPRIRNFWSFSILKSSWVTEPGHTNTPECQRSSSKEESQKILPLKEQRCGCPTHPTHSTHLNVTLRAVFLLARVKGTEWTYSVKYLGLSLVPILTAGSHFTPCNLTFHPWDTLQPTGRRRWEGNLRRVLRVKGDGRRRAVTLGFS